MIPSLALDILVVVVLVSCILYYSHKGLVGGIVDFFGSFAALAVSIWGGMRLAQPIFDNWFRERLLEHTFEALNDQAVTTLDQVLERVVGYVPQDMLASILGYANAPITSTSMQAAEMVVDTVIAPILVPLITLMVFVAIFLLGRAVVFIISAMVSRVNKVPVAGKVNKILGAVAGLLIGLLYTFLIMCVIWGVDAAYMENGLGVYYFSQSIVYRLLLPLNIFA